jgi:hypothetical protein
MHLVAKRKYPRRGMSEREAGKLGGRPTKLTPKLEAEISEHVRQGVPYELAALAAGIDEKTVYNWLLRGQRGEEPYSSFFQAITQGKAGRAVKCVGNIVGMEKGWQSQAWWLERIYPQHFARQEAPQVIVNQLPATDMNVIDVKAELRRRQQLRRGNGKAEGSKESEAGEEE